MLSTKDITFGPVPVGGDTSIMALVPQVIFKSLDVLPVPGKEETRSVNLCRVRSREKLKRTALTLTFKSM